MKFNLIQIWLMLQLTIRESEAEGVVVLDIDTYNAIKRKVDGMLREVGVGTAERALYTLEEDKRVRASERSGDGDCAVCGRRHIHADDCATLKRRMEVV